MSELQARMVQAHLPSFAARGAAAPSLVSQALGGGGYHVGGKSLADALGPTAPPELEHATGGAHVEAPKGLSPVVIAAGAVCVAVVGFVLVKATSKKKRGRR